MSASDEIAEGWAGEQEPGLVCTFYSYKGGVGRSMTLANVAALLARWGKKVLVVDWDLEAPGLEKYFDRPGGLRLSRDTPGLLDTIVAFAPGERLAWRDGLLHAPLAWHDGSLSVPVRQGTDVAILHAGRREASYLDRLRQLDWRVLFDNGLGVALELMRTEWQEDYDFVLIDSRTGITDIGGICTIMLPDYVLAMFTANEQSLEGIRETMQRVQALQANLPLNRRRLVVIPIAARDESNSEYQRAAEWRTRFADALAPFYRDWIPKGETAARVLDYLKIPNVPFWSFGEQLPVLVEAYDNPHNLAYSYGLIARLINSRLDWSEVREGGRKAVEEQARQAAAAEERAIAARTLREKAQQADLRRAEQRLQALRDMIMSRWMVLFARAERETVRLRRLSAAALLSGVVIVGFVLALVIYSEATYGEMIRSDLLPKANLGAMGFIIFVVLYAIGFGYIVLRSNYRSADGRCKALEREKLNLETGVNGYANLAEETGLRRFAARIEDISTGGTSDAQEPKPPPSATTGAVPTPPVALAPIAASPAPSAVASPDGIAAPSEPPAAIDVLLCYQPTPLFTDWEAQFKSLLQLLLGDALGREANVWAVDGPDNAAKLSAVFASDKVPPVSVILVSRRLLGSEWGGPAISTIIGASDGIRVFPVTLDRYALAQSKDLIRYQAVDFSDLVYVGEAFAKSERYLDFQDRVRNIAQAIAQSLHSDLRAVV